MITDLKINEEKKKEYYEMGYWTHDTIRDVWERQARANANKEYVADDQGCRMTYGEVDDAASRLAAWLVSQGIKPGDVVTLQFPNWAEFTIAYVACFKAGAVIQSLARNFNGADLTYAMNLVESRAYIGPTSFPGIEVRYIDEQGNDVAPGVQGEHISRGPHQFVGYLNEPERTDRALTDDGWWFSGDLGYMDEDGRIRINGRRKEIIIRGGENLSAREIDDNLVGCPGVGESATIGMPDDRLGERICTFVAPLGDTVPTLESVTAYLEGEGVPKRLWPERFEIIDEIPKTLMGKVRRNVLTDELAARMA